MQALNEAALKHAVPGLAQYQMRSPGQTAAPDHRQARDNEVSNMSLARLFIFVIHRRHNRW